jgi:type VI secretion system protein ImpL
MWSVPLVGQIEAIVSSLNWLDWLYLGIAFVLLCILILLVYRRKHANEINKPIIAELTVPAKVVLPVNSLVTIWKRFVSAVPFRLRPKALRAPFSIVIGDSGSGKSSIIDNYADWRGQNFRFYPSFVEDPLLQIYLGAKSLVLEFGSSLIFDTTTSAFLALKKLWRHLPPNPQVVMVVDATSLITPKTDDLRKLGYALFGKLKVFEELEEKSLPVVLALSNMDKIQGFAEFASFLKESGIPMQFDFTVESTIGDLEFCLDSFQIHLNRALITQNSQNYLKIVEFINKAPSFFRVLIDFIRVAGLEHVSEAPSIIRLCLLSNQVNSFDCLPFALPIGIEQKPKLNLNNHAKFAFFLALLGVIYFIGSYTYQQKMVTESRDKIKTVATTPIQYYSDKISPLFHDFTPNLNKHPLLTFMPNFFIDIEKENNYLLISEIRKNYLLPLLKKIQNEDNSYFKTMRLVGLLYATKTNGIGMILDKNPEKNPIDIILYGNLVADYLEHNTHTEDIDPILNDMDINKYHFYIDDNTSWIMLFHSLEQLLKKPFVEEKEIETLKEKLVPFLGVMDSLDYYVEHDEISEWLKNNTGLRLNTQNESELRQRNILKLLTLVNNLKIERYYNCIASSSLKECLDGVQIILNDKKTDDKKSSIEFNLDNKHFVFDPIQFDDLIIRSKISLMLRKFINSHKVYDGSIFFSTLQFDNDLNINFYKNSGVPLTTRTTVDRRFTYDAFEQNVKPSVIAITDEIEKLPIDINEKKRFNEFIFKNFEVYSDEYVSAYLNYFKQFQVNIDSIWGINYVIDDIQKSNSQLQDVLIDIKTNTKLNLPEGPAFRSFAQKLAVFRFIHQLMEEKNGVYPRFQKYQSMMSQMQHEINSQDDYIPKKTEENGDLKAALPSIGRVAWAMDMNEESSYLKLVQNWLQSEGIQDAWQQPFLAPVQKVKEFGTNEINQMVNYIWSDIWDSNVLPLLSEFPFSTNAGLDKELTIDNLTRIFHPKQGEFWNTFGRYLAPMYRLNNGVWVRRQELNKSVVLPANLTERLNAIARLTNNLWNEQGNPKPLELLVKPGLLPTFDNQQMPNAPLVALTYLRKGGGSVLGFNQQSEWQKFYVEWWKIEPTIVGMEFRRDNDPDRAYADLSVSDSNWSLFRLLLQGRVISGQRYYWSVAHPNFPKEPLGIEFLFQSNPFALFSTLSGS